MIEKKIALENSETPVHPFDETSFSWNYRPEDIVLDNKKVLVDEQLRLEEQYNIINESSMEIDETKDNSNIDLCKQHLEKILKALEHSEINSYLISEYMYSLGQENEIVSEWLELMGKKEIKITTDDIKNLVELTEVLKTFIPTKTEKYIKKYLGISFGREGKLKGMFAIRSYAKRRMQENKEVVS
jgi:hypothetical protein